MGLCGFGNFKIRLRRGWDKIDPSQIHQVTIPNWASPFWTGFFSFIFFSNHKNNKLIFKILIYHNCTYKIIDLDTEFVLSNENTIK